MLNNKFNAIKELLISLILFLIGLSSVIFSALFFDAIGEKSSYNICRFYTSLSVLLISISTVLSLIFYRLKYQFVYKIFLLIVIIYSVIITALFIYKKSGLSDKISSVNDLRTYVSGFAGYSILIYVIIQFLQVIILPIPALISVGAGVLLFGPFYAAIYSIIGITIGSIVAFFVGRKLGYNVVKWLVGKKTLDKLLEKITGKDKALLTFMIIFPFFPDDILCFVAGITKISSKYFIIMIIITRIISTFCLCYSLNNSLIPFNTWWGILLWVLFGVVTIILTLCINHFTNRVYKK